MIKWPDKKDLGKSHHFQQDDRWNAAIDACVEAEKQGRMSVKEIEKIILDVILKKYHKEYEQIGTVMDAADVIAQAISEAMEGE